MGKLISIIIPCFNQAHFLDECLQSVVNQTYTNWECIIVNDGSTDTTEIVAQKYIQQDSRFKYYSKPNGGLSNARNFGINLANGNYILPLDADDKISNDYLQLAMKSFSEDKNIGIVYGRAMNFGAAQNQWILPDYSFQKLLLQNMIYCSAIFKKELWLATGGYDENLKTGWEDWEFWINAISKTNVAVHKLNTICFYYRRKENSMLKGLNYNKEEQNNIKNYVYIKHISIYTKYFPAAVDAFLLNEEYQSKIKKWKQTFFYKIYKFFK